jgi:MFS transporter, OFA family, oxalate/formate antiporter
LDDYLEFAHLFVAIPTGCLVHYCWVIAGACLVIGLAGYGTFFSFTMFYPFLVEEFGWSRAGVSGAMSLGLIVYGMAALPMGWCVDRFGPRITITIGGVLLGVGTALGAFISEAWHLYALYGGIAGVGMGAAWAPLVSTVSRWFISRRGLASGIAAMGGGTGTLFMAPIVEVLIREVGWREAYLWLGLLCGGLIVGSAMFLYRDPAVRGMRPYEIEPRAGEKVKQAEAVNLGGIESGGTIQEIMRTGKFWWMILTFGLWWFGGAIGYVQIAPFVLEKGFDIGFAALVVVMFGVGNGVGKIVMGVTSDRLSGRLAYQIAIVVASLGMLGMAFSQSGSAMLVSTAVFGFGLGGVTPQLTTIGVALFGVRSVGALMGAILALIGMAGALGAFVSGYIYDASGSYTPAFLAGAGTLALSMLLALGLRR